MGKHHISINDIPKEGLHVVVDDQDIWTGPLDEFNMQCQIVEPVSARLDLLPLPGGVMVKGTIGGSVELSCNRCIESMRVDINAQIERFEGSSDMALGYEDDDEECFDESGEIVSHIKVENAQTILDVAGLCWEEFMLAFPLNPLCSVDCKGLCAVCGTNLNEEKCLCTQDSGDARLAVLRSVKIKSVDD